MMRNVTGVMKDSLDRAEAWVGRLRTVGLQRDTTQVEDGDITSEFEFSQRGSQHEPDQEDIPSSPFFSASSTVWGSSIPSTPAGDTFTPAYAAGGGAASPGVTLPIGAMSLSSRYETPRSGILNLADEEEEEEGSGEEGKSGGVVKKDDDIVLDMKKEEEGNESVQGVDGGGGKGLKMKMDVDV